jgi:hypothetical protein
VIVAVRKYRSYWVKFASSSVLWRNRRFLRLMVPTKIESGSCDTSTSLPVDVHNAKADAEVPGKEQPRIDALPAILHRSTRTRNPRVMFSI